VAFAIARFGGRGVFPFLSGGVLLGAALSFVISRFFWC